MASAAVPETSFGWAISDYLSIHAADLDRDAKHVGTCSNLTELIFGELIDISFSTRFIRQIRTLKWAKCDSLPQSSDET